MYHEGFTKVDMIAFCSIWVALAIYSFSQISFAKRPNDLEQVS